MGAEGPRDGSRRAVADGAAVNLDDLSSREIKVGLRCHFGSANCCNAMPFK